MLSNLLHLCASGIDHLQRFSFKDELVRRTGKKTMAWKLLLVVLALVCAPSPKAWGAFPLSDTLSPTATAPISWIGTATGPANASPVTSCREGLDCDTFILTFSGTTANWAGKTARIKISWQLAATDYDLYILKELSGGGSYVLAQAANHLANSETIDFNPSFYGTGRYLVRVMYTAANFEDQYNGSATVVPTESSCRVPGLTVLTDQAGDAIDTQSNHDIERVSVAEPYLVGASKLVFTIKVGNLNSLTTDTFWRVYFRTPNVNSARYFVDMRVNPLLASNQHPLGAVEYKYGVGDDTTLGDADEGHYNPQTGTITITVAHIKVGNPRPNQSPAHYLAQIYAQVLVGIPTVDTPSNPYFDVNLSSALLGRARVVDSAPNTDPNLSQASYQVVGNGSCNPGMIAFSSNHDGNDEIYVMNANGSNPINLTNHLATDFGPSWSPDGKKITFASSRAGSHDIFVMETDGSNQSNLTNMPGSDLEPAWSPDGTKIAFDGWRDTGLEPGTAQIYVMNASGSNQVRLTHDQAYYRRPTWSPDGQKLLFWGGNGITQIFVMDADGTNLTQLTNDSFINQDCAWSPDGSRIVFTSTRNGNYEVYVMNADGSDPKRLTNNSTLDINAAWSPDGLSIIFASNRDGNYELYAMNADGSNQTRLTNSPANEYSPAWQPFSTSPSPPSIIAMNKSADFDGDNKADLAVWQYSNSYWNIINSSNGSVRSESWGEGGVVPVPQDYDGDGKTDLGVYYQNQGIWMISLSTGGIRLGPFGQASGVPVPGDYDGDGKADIARYQASDGNWHIIQTSNGQTRIQNWGGFYDRPVPGDYDGDGKTDIAVYKANEGSWYIVKSSGGTVVRSWGTPGDDLVPADYDGDGKTDLAVFRPSEGNWYIIRSSTGLSSVQQWGLSGDALIPADYDGDGKADLAIWRRSTGAWWILKSSDGTIMTYTWGQQTDLPVLYFGFA